ncbi:unnamed protein product [Caenorhabditis angaria]|uniref:Uncharacterized protein n=1 Tax=Caenorhabditis angaria TaxID=860376 RepID=A0A9P1IZT1_9PELO|nr:unnamed protein product [Caenorhabditis angaria]
MHTLLLKLWSPINILQANELQYYIGKCMYILEVLVYYGLFMSEIDFIRVSSHVRNLIRRFQNIRNQHQYLSEVHYLKQDMNYLWCQFFNPNLVR